MAKINTCHTCIWEKGDRQGYSNGILTLAIGTIVLLLIFDGQTESLILLYTIRVFIPLPFSNRDGDPLKRHYQKDFLSIRLPISWGSHLLWDCLDPLIIPFAEIWPFFPYYWSLALDVLEYP